MTAALYNELLILLTATLHCGLCKISRSYCFKAHMVCIRGDSFCT
jgi:hypothetical protein